MALLVVDRGRRLRWRIVGAGAAGHRRVDGALRRQLADHSPHGDGGARRRRFPEIDIRFADAQGDVGRQLSQIQNFAAQDAAAIIVNAADTSATPGMTKIAREAGVPLVYVNRRPAEETLPAASCSSGPKIFRQARWRWKSSRG